MVDQGGVGWGKHQGVVRWCDDKNRRGIICSGL